MIPRRTRSYTNRSAWASAFLPADPGTVASCGPLRVAPATVVRARTLAVIACPSNKEAKEQVQTTESHAEHERLEIVGQQQREQPQGREQSAHHGDGSGGGHAGGD